MKRKGLVLLLLGLIVFSVLPSRTMADVTSVTYSGTINGSQEHIYRFSTSGSGTIQIDDQSSSPLVSVQLSDDNDVTYSSGDTLPAGNYKFVVHSDDTSAVNYQFTLSGVPFVGTPSTALPSLSLTNPSTTEKRLTKGATTMTVTGTTTGSTTKQYINNVENTITGSSFSKYTSFQFGRNQMNINTALSNGNAISDYHTIIAPGSKRIGGADRYEVSANISKEISIFNSSDTVVIANGTVFTDGLTSIPLAVQLKAPILLNPADTLNTNIRAEIQRRQPKKAYIIGGTGSISTNIESELQSLGVTDIQRIDGADRYEVSVNVSNQVKNDTTDSAFLINGNNFSDGLAIAGIAGLSDKPILYTNPSALPNSVKDFLNQNPQIKHINVIGGTASVSDSVLTELQSMGKTVKRIDGSDRFEVAFNAAEEFAIKPIDLVATDGTNFPDGISGGVLAALHNTTLLLTTPTSIPQFSQYYLEKYQYDFNNIYILGSEGSISSTVAQQIDSYIH